MKNKTLTLFIVISLLLATLGAQSYTPVIINGEVFFKTELETSSGVIFSEVTVANFEQIDGILYTRVFFKRGFEPDMFIGHLREEPGLGRLYFRPLSSNEDWLVYDISLEIGDTVSLSARWCDNISGDIAEVVDVIEQDGVREVIFDRQVGEQDICETLRFIEGVGPSASVIFPFFSNALLENGAAQRICHASRSAVIFYPFNADTDLCGLDITSTDDLDNFEVSLFPNPARDHISITLPGSSTLDYALIYNALGKPVWEGRLARGENIDISAFTAGIYHIVFTSKGKPEYSERFLKL